MTKMVVLRKRRPLDSQLTIESRSHTRHSECLHQRPVIEAVADVDTTLQISDHPKTAQASSAAETTGCLWIITPVPARIVHPYLTY